MIEGLAVLTGVELGKHVLEQVLKPVLESYVQDFFRDSLDSGVARLNITALKTPMAEAIGVFMQRFIKELQFNDIPDTSINHHYNGTIKKFVQNKAVRPILGKGFETGCKKIDYDQLQQIWTEQHQKPDWQFPSEEFDWPGVAKEYVVQVKAIIKADAALRAILDSDLLEDIARNTAQLSPGFDTETYRASLQASYGYLRLYTLDSTDRADTIKLWNIFIEQTVREALPPTRYDLPLDVKRQLQAEVRLEENLPTEALEYYPRDYFQHPARKVLESIADSPRTVILGDPGAGKSSLLQYLALEWVEGNTDTLPLLIELREFALADSANFLDFLHRGRGVDWQFDQQQLHQHLLESPTLVMFDGLDEIFDRATQAAVIDDIIRFAQQYPQARVLVTSRIVGYNHERLQHSGFRHFALQSLDTDEIHEFIDRWYDLSMGSDPDRERLKQRLKDAITNSKAIQNLADNPLLLTMMAILNRRQELPRDRADLYDQASRVLLYHWDVDHKRLNLPMDAIGRREKQEMLRAIAYEMQAGEDGLKGNLISADRLTQILTNYLRDQGFSEPREKAHRLIQQLRERNFILCYRGADTYGFMHRTFLEYFCAIEIVHRFEKNRTLSFEQLRDEVFGGHWNDRTWHEVLRLICGMISPNFAGQLIIFLTQLELSRHPFLDSSNKQIRGTYRHDARKTYLMSEGLINLLLASDCFSEVKNRNLIDLAENILLQSIKKEFQKKTDFVLSWDASKVLVEAMMNNFRDHPKTFSWLESCIQEENDQCVRSAALEALSKNWNYDSRVFHILQKFARLVNEPNLQQTALLELAKRWRQEPITLTILKECACSKKCHFGVRSEAITAIAKFWKNEEWVFDFIHYCALADPFLRTHESQRNPRWRAVQALSNYYPKHPETSKIISDRAANDSDEQLRQWAKEKLIQSFIGEDT
ncbi:MAG: NTPase (NACHT family) [Leptolyngbya sp.]|nr:MAG: NTPase (NACHT family) [Leptolyngbya sp.]